MTCRAVFGDLQVWGVFFFFFLSKKLFIVHLYVLGLSSNHVHDLLLRATQLEQRKDRPFFTIFFFHFSHSNHQRNFTRHCGVVTAV